MVAVDVLYVVRPRLDGHLWRTEAGAAQAKLAHSYSVVAIAAFCLVSDLFRKAMGPHGPWQCLKEGHVLQNRIVRLSAHASALVVLVMLGLRCHIWRQTVAFQVMALDNPPPRA